MMGVIITFLVSIFTAGYEGKPGKWKKDVPSAEHPFSFRSYFQHLHIHWKRDGISAFIMFLYQISVLPLAKRLIHKNRLPYSIDSVNEHALSSVNEDSDPYSVQSNLLVIHSSLCQIQRSSLHLVMSNRTLYAAFAQTLWYRKIAPSDEPQTIHLMNHDRRHWHISNNRVLHASAFYHLSKNQADESDEVLYLLPHMFAQYFQY